MKNILRLLIILLLLVFGSTGALGATHHLGERLTTDTWYSITPINPYWQLFFNTRADSRAFSAGGEIFLDDQTFFWLNSSKVYRFELSELSGSYLFESGFFIGFDYYKTPNSHVSLISPGYRFSFNEDSYLAFSLDYESSSDIHQVAGYDVDLCYYFKSAKLSGEVYRPKAGDTSIYIEVAFSPAEGWVIGLDYTNIDNTYSAGFTYTHNPMIIDFQFYNEDDYDDSYKLSGMFDISEHCSLGLEYQKYNDSSDPKVTLKFKFAANNANLKLFYTPENDSWDTSYGIAWYANF